MELTIGAYGPGDDVPHMTLGFKGEEDGEGNSLRGRIVSQPSAGARNLYDLVVQVHSADSLRKVPGLLGEDCHPAVQVDFNGSTLKTRSLRSTTTPTWNEEIHIPFTVPCWDDSIVLHLLSDDVLLGEVLLHLDSIVKASLPPTWFNFYCCRVGVFAKEAERSLYAGRLLISVRMERAEKPSLVVSPSTPVSEPATIPCVLWADVYEVCFEGSDAPDDARLLLSVSSRDVEFARPTRRRGGAFIWEGDAGRLPELDLEIPALHMCSDIICSVVVQRNGWLQTTTQRHMFCRIPGVEVFNWEARRTQTRWFEMRLVEGGDCFTAGVVLMSLTTGPRGRKRPPREALKMRRYLFRAILHQAVNLPCADDEGTSDPFVLVMFGSLTLRTTVVPQSTHASWHEALEAEVELPELVLPDVVIVIVDEDEKDMRPLAQARYTAGLPSRWTGPPRWLDMDPMPNGPSTQARVLVSFELSLEAPSLPRLQPSREDCQVEIFAVGLRWLPGATPPPINPMLEFTWGRREDNAALPKVTERTIAGKGAEGQYNFLQKVTLQCQLAKNPLYQEWLEVKIQCGEKPVAFGVIHLTPHLPWVDAEERADIAKRFRIQTQEDLNLKFAQQSFHDAQDKGKPSPRTTEHPESHADSETAMELELCRSFGWGCRNNRRVKLSDDERDGIFSCYRAGHSPGECSNTFEWGRAVAQGRWRVGEFPLENLHTRGCGFFGQTPGH